MAVDRLVGSDASLYKGTLGTVVNTGVMTSGTWYKLVTISGVVFTGYQAGDLVLGNGQALSAGNTAGPMTFDVVTDCNGFTLEFSADEIEVTTLADGNKKYRKGKADMSGTVTGIDMISEMKKAGSFVNRFLRINNVVNSTNVSTLTAQSTADLYGKFFLQDDTTTGEVETFLFSQIELFGFTLGADIGSAQTYSSGVRCVGSDPMLFFVQR